MSHAQPLPPSQELAESEPLEPPGEPTPAVGPDSMPVRWRAAIVAGACALGSFAVLAGLGRIPGPGPALARMVLELAAVSGSAAMWLVGAARLRESREAARRHAETHRRQSDELDRVQGDLEATSDLLHDLRLNDALTGARNRRYLSELSGAAIARRGKFEVERGVPRRGWDGVGVVVVDIDGFKGINQTFGHPAGDRVLAQVARTLRRCLRPDDTLVRWGGDEFLALLAGADPGRTGDVADRIAQALSGELCEIRPRESLALSCSAGWSHVDWQESGREPLESAVAAAHAALYRAKREGPGSAVASQPLREALSMTMSA